MMPNADTFNLKISLLRKQLVFSQLTDKEIEGLASLLTEKYYSPDEIIVSEGEPVDSVYLIVSGTADVRHIRIENQATHFESVATLGPGEAIGLNETGFYSISGVRTATVVALTDMSLLRLSVAAFHGFALAHSHVNEVMRKNAERILGIKS